MKMWFAEMFTQFAKRQAVTTLHSFYASWTQIKRRSKSEKGWHMPLTIGQISMRMRGVHSGSYVFVGIFYSMRTI